MTERSNYSATKGFNKALHRGQTLGKNIQKTETETRSMPQVSLEKKPHRGFGGIDSEKIRPPTGKVYAGATSQSKQWAPLH